jgi:hypothetical protein
MHEGLWDKLVELEAEEVALNAQCLYDREAGHYLVTFLDREYAVELEERVISSQEEDGSKIDAGFLEKLCILAYLINVSNIPLANKQASADRLPGGQFFFRGNHALPTNKIAENFGTNPSLLTEAGLKLGGKRLEFADSSIILNILPKVPIYIVLWGSDDEFNAKASILFDSTAADQIPLDALLTAANLAVNALIKYS